MSDTHTNTNDSTDRSDELNAALAEAAVMLLAAETPFTRAELADMNSEKLAHLFDAAFPETAPDEADEAADASAAQEAHDAESDDGDVDATATASDGDGEAVATNAAGRAGRGRDQPRTAGTSADYSDAYGDARRANSDRYRAPLVTDEMAANADAGPSEDASAGTMADHQDRDVDPVIPRRQQTEQGDERDDREQDRDFGWADNEDADGDAGGTLQANQSAYDRRKQAAENPAPGTMAAYRAQQAADDE